MDRSSSTSEATKGRARQIIRTSWIGIITNVLLAGFKAAVGILASSVAIVMDAVNNLSDSQTSATRQRTIGK